MQIGILQCDNVRSSLSPEYGEYPEMIEQKFAKLGKPQSLQFQIYRTHEGVLPDSVDECEAYIITGSRHSVLDTDELWIHQLQNFIVRLNKAKIKTIGICFGHQVMAVAMGGKVERADCGWQIGVHRTRVLHEASFMRPYAEYFHVAMLCEDQVDKIAGEVTVLATTPKCDFAMLMYGEHFLSIQGHPEFSPEFAKALLAVRQDEFPSKRLDVGMASFSTHKLDGERLFTWFLNFLCQVPEAVESEEKLASADN